MRAQAGHVAVSQLQLKQKIAAAEADLEKARATGQKGAIDAAETALDALMLSLAERELVS